MISPFKMVDVSNIEFITVNGNFFLYEFIFLIFVSLPGGDRTEGFCEGRDDVKTCSRGERSVALGAVPGSTEEWITGFTGEKCGRRRGKVLKDAGHKGMNYAMLLRVSSS